MRYTQPLVQYQNMSWYFVFFFVSGSCILERRRSGLMLNRLFHRLPLERILVFTSLALGLLHAWFGRYSMNPDGISYLDVGDSFFRRDWANAVNAW